MYALVIDTSTAAVTAGLARVDSTVELVAQRTTVDARAHGELLAPSVDAVLHEAAVAPHDLSAVVAGVGPGPFTGLRVGLVTAAALGQALNIPTYGVCSLDALGYGRPGTVLVATDARRREVYWALYRDGVRETGPAVARPSAIAVTADYALGDKADQIGLPVREEPRYPPPLALAELAADRIRAGKPSERLTPLYLRRPDAVAPTTRKTVLT
jgi:tRNA threonylcarbamoyl adenosine modification protein YeaZ